MKYHRLLVLSVVLGGLALPPGGLATTRVWDGGAATANWFDGNNWNPDGVPAAGDQVIIGASSVILSNSTAVLDSFAITNGTLTFTNWSTVLTATNVSVSGTVTHYANTATSTNLAGLWVPDARIQIVCTSLTVAANGTISADAKGYRSGTGAVGVNGSGPGAGTNEWLGSGGGYGGKGGASPYYLGGRTYGSPDDPSDPGSGSGGRNTGTIGGAGGGLIQLDVAGWAIVDGLISAGGGSNPGDAFGGGGSGGGIRLRCASISGAGKITAHGGAGMTDSSNRGGGGGGGRVAVIYDLTAQAARNLTAKPTIQFGANAGQTTPQGAASPDEYVYVGEPGTVYLPDASFFPTPVMQGGQIIIPGVTSFTANSLTITNGLAVFTNGVQLTVSNNLTLFGDFGGLRTTNGT